MYAAEVEELTGCVTQGSTVRELLANLAEAIEGNVEARKSVGYAMPNISTDESR